MDESEFAVVHAAVTIARDKQPKTVRSLRSMMVASGYSEDDASKAILIWAEYERAKGRRVSLTD